MTSALRVSGAGREGRGERGRELARGGTKGAAGRRRSAGKEGGGKEEERGKGLKESEEEGGNASGKGMQPAGEKQRARVTARICLACSAREEASESRKGVGGMERKRGVGRAQGGRPPHRSPAWARQSRSSSRIWPRPSSILYQIMYNIVKY